MLILKLLYEKLLFFGDKIPIELKIRLKQFFYLLRYLLFIGKTYYCPLCSRHYRKFLPYTIKYNQVFGYSCPKDDSLARHRLILLYLKNKTNFFIDNLNVLHFSPQYCLRKRFGAMGNLKYIYTNLESSNVTINMNITNILFKEKLFDVIFCIHVLEHVLDDKKAIQELFRVLKPGGWAIIQSPLDNKRNRTYEDSNIIDPKDREKYFGQHNHVRIYGQDFKKRLENVGFKVKVDDYVKSLSYDIIIKCVLNENDVIFFCTKPES